MRINKLKGGFRTNQLIRKGYSKPINPKNYGKVIVTVTPKEPNMKKKKLEIQNYDKELTMMIFWGWDILSADESEEVYTYPPLFVAAIYCPDADTATPVQTPEIPAFTIFQFEPKSVDT
jgi:hypothetical protein